MDLLKQGWIKEVAVEEAAKESLGELRRQTLDSPALSPPRLDDVSALSRRFDA